MTTKAPTESHATVIQLKQPLDPSTAPPPPPPPPTSTAPIPQMPSVRSAHDAPADQSEIDAAHDLVTQARSILEAACQQVDDMISSARDIIVKAESQADTIIEEARVAAQRIAGEAREQASSIERAAHPPGALPLYEGDAPAPQKKSFAAMWARAGEEVGSVDDFMQSFEQPSTAELAKKLGPRWRQG